MTELLDLSLEDRAFQTWSMGFLSLDTNALAEYEAYRNIKTRQDLEAIACRDDKIFGLVRGLYVANAGRGF